MRESKRCHNSIGWWWWCSKDNLSFIVQTCPVTGYSHAGQMTDCFTPEGQGVGGGVIKRKTLLFNWHLYSGRLIHQIVTVNNFGHFPPVRWVPTERQEQCYDWIDRWHTVLHTRTYSTGCHLAVTSRLRKPTVYPRPILRTKRYCSAVSYALLNFQ